MFQKMTSFFKKDIGIFYKFEANNAATLLNNFQQVINFIQKKYFTAGLHTKYVTDLEKDRNLPEYLPLATKYFKSLKTFKYLLEQAETSRKEKKKIKEVVFCQ